MPDQMRRKLFLALEEVDVEGVPEQLRVAPLADGPRRPDTAVDDPGLLLGLGDVYVVFLGVSGRIALECFPRDPFFAGSA